MWQKADDLAILIYLKTKNFPHEEKFGAVSQIRRSALSVPTNIVEGFERQGRKEFKNFLNVALGSLAETEYLIDFSLRMGFLNADDHKELQDLRHEVGCLLWKFYKML